MAMGAHSAAYLTMEPWDPSELSSGCARGIFWFFTEFPRIGEKICRKTVDGLQTWSGRSGRVPKNGFPIEILVAKLVIKDTGYHMLELTLDKEKPTVSLCKIWRKGTAAAESPQTKNQGTSTSNQVQDNLEAATEMQIDQPQEYLKYNLIGQYEGTEQQLHVPHRAMSTSNYTRHPNSTCGYFNDNLFTEQFEGQFEGIEQESHMPDQTMSESNHTVPPNPSRGQLEGVEEQVELHEDLLAMNEYVVLPTFTEDFIHWTTGQDDNSVYQGAVSYLYKEKESFRHIVSHGGNEAHEIASKAQSLACAVKNVLNRFTFLGINTQPANTRPASNTTNSNQLRTTTNSVTERATMPAPETTTQQDEFPEQERRQQMEDWCFIDEDNFPLDDDVYQSGN